MARHDQSGSPADDSPGSSSSEHRLDDLERRLEAAFQRLEGRDAAAAREGETLRQRRARLRERVQGGAGGASVLGEIESLTDAIDRWVSHIDQSQAQDTRRTLR